MTNSDMKRTWLTFVVLCLTVVCSARELTDTVWTDDNDRIIIKYDLKYNSRGVKIQFVNVRKKLARTNEKYDAEKVEVVFFDRTGVYDDVVFSNMDHDAFMVPYNLRYSSPEQGYFFLSDEPSLSFEFEGDEDASISIPLYLAYYQGKEKRKLFSVCKDFNIELDRSASSGAASAGRSVVSETVTTTIELESEENELAIEVASQINTVRSWLEHQTKAEFSDNLKYEIDCLRDLQKKVTDRQLKAAIKECLDECDLKKKELQEQEESERARMEDEAAKRQMLMQQNMQQSMQAHQDSIAAVQQKQAESDKKRNIWMIIGGAILAVLCFVGNQLFQHFRSIRNQRSMLEMQQDISRRAESEAKRHAYNYARKKTNEVVDLAKKGSQDMIRNRGKQPKGNKNKNISI